MTLPAVFKGKQRHGFTLIELVLAIAIFALVALAAMPLYGRLQTSTQLNESTNELAQTIRLARTHAVARRNDAAHGVYMTASSYTLYQGASYASRDTAYDRVVTLDDVLTLSHTLTGNEVTFSNGLGVPDTTGTITLTHAVQGSKTITLDSLGTVQ